MRPSRLTTVVLTVVAALGLTGCGASTSAPGTGARPTTGSAAEASKLLAELTIAASGSMAGYTRDRFPHWSDQGGGCRTRDVVLKRDGMNVNATGDCRITAGRWYSVYDKKTFTDPQQIDIDHMVALANAWRSGASAWDDKKREQFANDLTRPQLIAVSASSNRAKGDQSPAQWKPTNRDYWCEYAGRWIAVKHYWQLTVTTSEVGALTDMLTTCRGD